MSVAVVAVIVLLGIAGELSGRGMKGLMKGEVVIFLKNGIEIEKQTSHFNAGKIAENTESF